MTYEFYIYLLFFLNPLCISLFLSLQYSDCISCYLCMLKNKAFNAWQSDSIFLSSHSWSTRQKLNCLCELRFKFYGDKIAFWREFEKRQEAEIRDEAEKHIISLVVLLFVLCTEQMKPHKPLAFHCAMTEFNGQVSPPSTSILFSLSKPLLSHCLPTHMFSFLFLRGYVGM